MIEKLKESLQELRATTVLETKYRKREINARLDAAKRVYRQTEKEKDSSIVHLEVHSSDVASMTGQYRNVWRLSNEFMRKLLHF